MPTVGESVRISRCTHVRLLSEAEPPAFQHCWIRKARSLRGNRLDGGLTVELGRVAQQGGHRCCEPLEPHIVEDRGKFDVLNDGLYLDFGKARIPQLLMKLVRGVEGMLAAFGFGCIRPKDAVKRKYECGITMTPS